jgi:predicted transcriptional regulator
MFKRLFSLLPLVISLRTVTVKVDEELKRKMNIVKVNWSEYIREAIQRRVELEERRNAAKKLLEDLKAGKHVAPKGFINKTIREIRETR